MDAECGSACWSAQRDVEWDRGVDKSAAWVMFDSIAVKPIESLGLSHTPDGRWIFLSTALLTVYLWLISIVHNIQNLLIEALWL